MQRSIPIFFITCLFFSFGVIGQSRKIDPIALLTNTRLLSSDYYQGRKTGTVGGERAKEFVTDKFSEIGLLNLHPDGFKQDFSFYNRLYNLKANGSNIIGYLEGELWQDPKEGCIIVGAHYDHLGIFGGNTYYGADDNASGVAALIEIAKSFKETPPQIPIVFISFDAEEMACEGSKYFVESSLLPHESIFLFINLDMISISDKSELGVSGTHYHHEYKKMINEAASGKHLKMKYGHDNARDTENYWVESSDHREFHKYQIPFIYFGVEEHEHYHRTTDTFENIDIGFFVESAQSILEFVDLIDNKKSFQRYHQKLLK
ncbi:M20/M25/M40 family metallo-hydrolase [Flammeovirga yaeyamensis]|uniref:M20/M25/M40 family metallo-hydrolase n=1 Tax=Flammeovirga yaeyamensis TaxID=367791 RepID=A0AAX1N223_9BACT|nr:M20/M25/M40 family metallo-hydrolase [Flammeovirga yaeyamensis]MBB3698087.1 hypothetical protein [Flammeovirga yaeyamensis]NMF34554.1 M20/M25/M40 family metallo-hydrolase [Flammeovirga yaeyamensis]QWG01531.1 M20/M25/M40 family metallo-hydrolase [Flammeovirga yaeyamensis]